MEERAPYHSFRLVSNTHLDLHVGNILLQLPSSLSHLSVEQLYAKFGAPVPGAGHELDEEVGVAGV